MWAMSSASCGASMCVQVIHQFDSSAPAASSGYVTTLDGLQAEKQRRSGCSLTMLGSLLVAAL